MIVFDCIEPELLSACFRRKVCSPEISDGQHVVSPTTIGPKENVKFVRRPSFQYVFVCTHDNAMYTHVKTNYYYLLTSPGVSVSRVPRAGLYYRHIIHSTAVSPLVLFTYCYRGERLTTPSRTLCSGGSPLRRMSTTVHTGDVRYFRSRKPAFVQPRDSQSDNRKRLFGVRRSSVWVRFPFGKQRRTTSRVRFVLLFIFGRTRQYIYPRALVAGH